MLRLKEGFNTAKPIKLPSFATSRSLSLKGKLTGSDPLDFYQFQLRSSSHFYASLEQLKGNLDVRLFNNKRKAIASSLNPGRSSEYIDATLKPGKYYLEVRRGKGKIPYKLITGLEEPEVDSSGVVQFSNASETAFNPTQNAVSFGVTGASFSVDPLNITVYRNDELLPDSTLIISPTSITIPFLTEGLNEIELYAADGKGLPLYKRTTLWAGSQSLTATVVNADNQPVANAAVTATLGDNADIQLTTLTNAEGQASFANLPDRTISLEALTSNNEFAFTATTGSAGTATLVLSGFNPPSLINNDDFSLGTEGWDIGSAPVELIPHVEEDSSLVRSTRKASLKTPTRQSRQYSLQPVKVSSTNRATPAPSGDQDLVLNTSGEGPQSISRTFQTTPGMRTVNIRYKFITSEVPGGYFGTQFNDYFKVSIRGKKTGGFASVGNSMNGLGLGAFTPNGATAWRELTLPVHAEGDTVQVNLTVANVADGLLDSQLVVDKVDKKKLDITQLALKDIDNSGLRYLSAAPHSYFNGNTRINGTIALKGDKQDKLTGLTLEVVQGGKVAATANLTNAVKKTLLNQPFGEDETIAIPANQLLFELPSAQTKQLNSTNVTLQVRAKSSQGEEATKVFKSVPILVRYTGNNRYPPRDVNEGGDDWVRPNIVPVLQYFRNITIGDISNMNGGLFPPHETHQDGTHIDGKFPGYDKRNAATAKKMLQYLNDPVYGSRIRIVYVTFQKTKKDAFWNAIKNVTLNNGRSASSVIQRRKDHTTHFHWAIKEN